MTYLTTISIPVSFEADNDDQARAIVEHLLHKLAVEVELPHDAQVYDAPTPEALEESLPYQVLRQVYVTTERADGNRFDRYPDEVALEIAAGDCLQCQDAVYAANHDEL